VAGTSCGAVDVHGHAIPETVLDLIENSGHLFGGISVERTDGKFLVTLPDGQKLRPLPRGMTDGPDRRRWMESQSVADQLVAPWLDVQGNGFEHDNGVAWASALNDAMAEGLPTIGERTHLLSTVYPADPEAAINEMLRARDELGAVGVMLATHFPQGSAADAEFEPFWASAAQEQIPVVLHPPIVGPASAIPGDKDFRSLYGRTLETSLAATRMIVNGLFDRLPDLKIVLVHGGGSLPYQAGRLDQQVKDGKINAQTSVEVPSDYLKYFFYDTAMLDPSVVRFLAERVPDRVVLGTDYPFTAASAIVPDQLAGLDPAMRDQVSEGVARGIFDLSVAETVA
jgi:aminocarboxymuconate-semialdehyde decarboxylase